MPFDFFILIFCVNALTVQFQTKVSAITEAIFLTLAMRPIGAFLFGLIADRFGRRPALMIDIIAYSVFELASAFAPSLKFFLIMRAFFGIAMGGEWGVGAALAFESLTRGRTRILLRPVAGRLRRWLSDGRSGVWHVVPARGMARHVRDRSAARIPGDLHSH